MWLGAFSIVVLVAAFNLFLGREAESTVSEQLLVRNQTLTRAQASNIISYFQTFGNSVAVLAQLTSIDRRDASTVRDIDTFVEQQRANGFIGGVILTDRNGVVRFNSNVLGTRDVGNSVADRDYFIWLRDKGKEGEYYVSEPIVSRLGATRDETIIVVASPVYQNGVFTGVIASSVKLAPLLERFFGLMKISDQARVHVVDGHGELLYSNSNPDAFGTNISEYFSDDQILRDRIEYALSASEGGQLKTETDLTAYSLINLETQNWLVIIFTPGEEVSDLVTPFYVRQTAVLILTSFTILLFGMMVIRRNKN